MLDRPAVERRREYQYRFGQSVVFGAPVVALHWFGRSLGGAEADRWVTLFQALLAGWVVYVAAAGMLSEGVLLLLARRRPPPGVLGDLLVAAGAVGLYLIGIPRLVTVLLAGTTAAGAVPPPMFHGAVALLALWTGARWWHLRRFHTKV